MNELPERRESLWLLLGAPTIWAVHFLLCYATAAIWCAKLAPPDGSLAGARIAIGIYSIVALTSIAAIAWTAYRHHRYGSATVPHDFATPEDRHRFLGFAGLLLAGLSGVSTLFVAASALFVGTCR